MTVKPVIDIDNNIIKCSQNNYEDLSQGSQNKYEDLSQGSQNNYEDFLSQDSQNMKICHKAHKIIMKTFCHKNHKMANKTCMKVQENSMLYFDLSLF